MKVLIEYEHRATTTHAYPRIKVCETRIVDDECYPRVIGRIMREFHDSPHELVNIRCLDPHPKDLSGC